MPYLADREAKPFVSNHHIRTKLLSEPGFKWHHPQLPETVTQSCLGCIQVSDHYSQGKVTQICRALQQPTWRSGTAISGSVTENLLMLCLVIHYFVFNEYLLHPSSVPCYAVQTSSPVHRPCQSSERQWDVAAGCFYYYRHRPSATSSQQSWLCHSSKQPIII